MGGWKNRDILNSAQVPLLLLSMFRMSQFASSCYGGAVDVADKVKVAASVHRQLMRESTVKILAARLKELERNGVALPLPKGKWRKRHG